MSDTHLSKPDGAALCAKSEDTLRRYDRQGKLPNTELRDGKTFYAVADLVAAELLDPSALTRRPNCRRVVKRCWPSMIVRSWSVGPNGAGKSTFAQEILAEQLERRRLGEGTVTDAVNVVAPASTRSHLCRPPRPSGPDSGLG